MLLWAAVGRLDAEARTAIAELAQEVHVSAASVWEIEIKRALGRLRAPKGLGRLVDESGFDRLEISFEHASAAGRLPPLHADPFDRMLVAQAQLERLTLATADQRLARYEVPILAVAEG